MSYFEENGIIREDLLDKEAERIARTFVVENPKNHRIDKRNSLSSAQLRRFFGEFRQLEKKANAKGFPQVKPLVKMVKSKASYAANRPTPIPKSFKEFLMVNIDRIDTEEDFKAFMMHFEAVVGFFYGIEGVRND